jgi:hypothetical protein
VLSKGFATSDMVLVNRLSHANKGTGNSSSSKKEIGLCMCVYLFDECEKHG